MAALAAEAAAKQAAAAATAAAAAECTVHAEVLYRSVRGGMDALLSDYRAYFAPEGADAARDFGLAAMRSAAELLALCTTKSGGGLDARCACVCVVCVVRV